MNIATLIELLGIVAKHSPSIATWLADLASGDKTAADQLRAILPMESRSAAVLREIRDDENK